MTDLLFWMGFDTKPIGGANPYRCCAGCERSVPQINGDLMKHTSGCPQVIKYLRTLSRTQSDLVRCRMMVEDIVHELDRISFGTYKLDDSDLAELKAELTEAILPRME